MQYGTAWVLSVAWCDLYWWKISDDCAWVGFHDAGHRKITGKFSIEQKLPPLSVRKFDSDSLSILFWHKSDGRLYLCFTHWDLISWSSCFCKNQKACTAPCTRRHPGFVTQAHTKHTPTNGQGYPRRPWQDQTFNWQLGCGQLSRVHKAVDR